MCGYVLNYYELLEFSRLALLPVSRILILQIVGRFVHIHSSLGLDDSYTVCGGRPLGPRFAVYGYLFRPKCAHGHSSVCGTGILQWLRVRSHREFGIFARSPGKSL